MDELDALFREVLELEPGTDVTGLEQASEERWDSLAHMTLIMAMESQFGIQVDLEEAVEIRSYRDAARLVERLRPGLPGPEVG
jgi:acyl carrier protein